MDKPMVWAGLLSLLIGILAIVVILKPTFNYYEYAEGIAGWMFIVAGVVIVGIVVAMFVVIGVVLALYGLLKK
jgi:hypothetical protein